MRAFRQSALVVPAIMGLLATYGCGDQPEAVSAPKEPLAVQSSVWRGPASQTIITALQNRALSDGTLLVGLKEPQQERGVDRVGRALPVAARLTAEQAVRAGFPTLNVINGVRRSIPRWRSIGVVEDTIYRTFLRVRPELNETFLERPRSHPNVDYIEPNYTNGTFAGRPEIVAASLVEVRPWGLDTVRAPSVWALGYTGGSVPIGMVDTGFDMQSAGFIPAHPDIEFNASFQNYVYDREDNRCDGHFGNTTPCYWEEPWHGMGVLGTAIAVQNNQASLGVAPSSSGGANIGSHSISISTDATSFRSTPFQMPF